MAEYIEREAAMQALLNEQYGYLCEEAVLAIPAADVVPVVRCRECKQGTRFVCDLAGNEYVECCLGNVAHRLDWFCAEGAKMEVEE